jgi:transposase
MAATTRKPYRTDLTDEQWAILEPLIPPAKPGGRPRGVDMRASLHDTPLALFKASQFQLYRPHFLAIGVR